MLSAPVKSARRISSLLTLGSNKDNPASDDSQRLSPHLAPQERRRARSASTRHEPVPYIHAEGTRPTTSSGPARPLDFNAPLPPPPSLLDVNQTLVDPSALTPPNQLRRQSRDGSSRPSSRRNSSVGPSPPTVLHPSSRAGSPGNERRRSWVSPKSRSTSIDARAMGFSAWVAGLEQKIPYDLGALTRGEPVWAAFFSLLLLLLKSVIER